jgi:hypothetical protein
MQLNRPPIQESASGNKHLFEAKITEYDGLLKGVEHSHSVAKDSIGDFYKKYLEDLRNLQKRVDDGKDRINIPQQLYSMFLHSAALRTR